MTLIKRHLGFEVVCTPGEHGQFDVIADGEIVAKRGGNWLTRQFGAGYPDLQELVEHLKKRRASERR